MRTKFSYDSISSALLRGFPAPSVGAPAPPSPPLLASVGFGAGTLTLSRDAKVDLDALAAWRSPSHAVQVSRSRVSSYTALFWVEGGGGGGRGWKMRRRGRQDPCQAPACSYIRFGGRYGCTVVSKTPQNNKINWDRQTD